MNKYLLLAIPALLMTLTVGPTYAEPFYRIEMRDLEDFNLEDGDPEDIPLIGTDEDSPLVLETNSVFVRTFTESSGSPVNSVLLRVTEPDGDVRVYVGLHGAGFIDWDLAEPGNWQMEALFLSEDLAGTNDEYKLNYPSDGPNVLVRKTLDFSISALVIPESPIGMIALVASSFAAMTGYVLWRRH